MSFHKSYMELRALLSCLNLLSSDPGLVLAEEFYLNSVSATRVNTVVFMLKLHAAPIFPF